MSLFDPEQTDAGSNWQSETGRSRNLRRLAREYARRIYDIRPVRRDTCAMLQTTDC
ncbi:hypothetical protein R69888_03918 [Paraburkholderia haematera]|uniref:Uncharacterized protein n=1 Tax=Paraburkholderia haematera TaxID=2793077 RepID=A0ABM8RUB6_9BURK|nr:hypothetical protein R69888_03918 [Paraburkholderia haematera]